MGSEIGMRGFNESGGKVGLGGGGVGICIDNVFDLVERVRVRRLTAREDSLRAAILVELHS